MKRYLYCVGVDYEFSGMAFQSMAERRAKRVWQENDRAREDVTFQIFDIRAGTVESSEMRWLNGKRSKKSSKRKTHEPITSRDYAKKAWKRSRRDVMSILDIYAEIKSIGATDPESLVETSFISHGWMGGPILVNSQDLSTNGLRDPDDMDPRIEKDLRSLRNSERESITRAFSSKAIVWQWGCNFPFDLNVVLNKLWKSGLVTTKSDVVTVSALNREEIVAFGAVAELLHLGKEVLISRKGFSVGISDVRNMLWICLKSTFPYVLWKTIGVSSIGALVGTYAERSEVVMKVLNPRNSLQIYHKLFKLRGDPEGNGYVYYSDAMMVGNA